MKEYKNKAITLSARTFQPHVLYHICGSDVAFSPNNKSNDNAFVRKAGAGAGLFGGTQALAAIAPVSGALATALVAGLWSDLDAGAGVQAGRSAADVVGTSLDLTK